MSMILDALQRADRERQKQDQPLPSLDTPVAPAPSKSPVPGWVWWLAGVGMAVAFVGALLIVTLNRSSPSPPTPQSEPLARTQPAQEPATAPEPPPTSASEPPTAKPPAIAELYQSPQVEDDSVTALYRTAKSGAEPASEEAEKTIEGAGSHTQKLPERPEPAAVRLSEETPEPDASTAASSERNAREPEPAPPMASIRDLPWNLQQTMPSLNYQQHDYRNGSASRIVINGQERRAGQQVAPDLTLERIEEDGAVMRYRGHQFKLRALNSWVNM